MEERGDRGTVLCLLIRHISKLVLLFKAIFS